MNLAALVLGIFLIAVAVYTASDPLSRARPWVSFDDIERAPQWAKDKQRTRAWLYSYVVGLMGVLFVALGLAL
ncbi:hypothetical protein [Halapricum desulfuricans]|uniref:Uncharacterized protein n=1 Tax=Halapricum desulfuricans TaxID=2841257 RepID=A0A897N804_9EURY|nr:hypothetical protein [Halapricum desulfuricans]QSG08398.1 hypothetical protein HSR122_0996 [Halapricum desulfuricans]